MTHLFVNRVSVVWGVLMLATGLSWWLGASHGAVDVNTGVTTSLLMLVAFFKVRLVILHFMEIKRAPTPLRIFCEGWVLTSCGVVLALYWLLG